MKLKTYPRTCQTAVASALFAILIASCGLAGEEPLCRIPENRKDFHAGTDCRLETGEFVGAMAAEPDTVSIVAYNVEHGRQYSRILSLFRSDADFSHPDVILLSEVDRNCPDGGRNTVRELARDLEMNYLFGVEYLEYPTATAERPCEHGNAILSRFPMGGGRRVDHRLQDRRFDDDPTGVLQIGGRMALTADLMIGEGTLRVYALHFASGPEDNGRRAGEAKDVVDDASGWLGPVVAGGDLNTGLYLLDLLGGSRLDKTPPVFLGADFVDAHSSLPLENRPTAGPYQGARLLLDLIFVRGASIRESLVCPIGTCGGISDHVPVLTRIVWGVEG